MKAVIAGLGSAGSRHFNNLHVLGVKQIAVVRSRNLPPPVSLKRESYEQFFDLDQVWKSGPDFLVISNPSFLHFHYAQAALERGIPVYLEKPMATSYAEGSELLALADKKNIPAQVGCQLRFDPLLLTVKKWINEKKLGNIHSISADMGEWLPGWHPWEDYRISYAAKKELGGGVLFSQIHDIDYLQWLFGPVEQVFALGGKRTSLSVDVEDTVILSLRFASGVPAQLRMDYWRKPATRSLHVVGDAGEIFWDYTAGLARLKDRSGAIAEEKKLPDGFDRNELFLSSMKNFLAMLNGEKNQGCTLLEGLNSIKIVAAAKLSLEERQCVWVNHNN